MDNRADILKMLKEQLEYHKTEVKRIESAIQAYTGDVSPLPQKEITTSERKTKWTKEIENIFETNDNLTADKIRDLLVKNGVDLASEPRGRSAMLTTLGRMVKNSDKNLILTDDSHYKKNIKKNESSEENFF